MSIVLAALALVAAYVVVGNLWHRVLAPFPVPDPATFPRAGDRLVSIAEGAAIHVDAVADRWIYATSVLQPGAKGPPMHVHTQFDEWFMPIKGTLHAEAGGRVVVLKEGETLEVPAGMPHRFWNPGPDEVWLGGTRPVMPVAFAALLQQLYRVIDERGASPMTMMLQMSVFDASFDTYVAEPPLIVQRITNLLLAPAARLLGYRNYYPEYALHPASSSDAPLAMAASQ